MYLLQCVFLIIKKTHVLLITGNYCIIFSTAEYSQQIFDFVMCDT